MWSFQWPAFVRSSTSSLASSNSIISVIFQGPLCFLLDLEWSVMDSQGPRFGDPSVRSTVALGLPGATAANSNPGIGGMKEWGDIETDLIPRACKALEKWCGRNGRALCTKFNACDRGNSTCHNIRIGTTRVSQRSLQLHGKKEWKTKPI